MIPVPDVTVAEVAFGAHPNHEIAPPWKDIPKEFKKFSGCKETQFASAIFFGHARQGTIGMLPRKGVDAEKAYKALRAILVDFGLSHEHKEAAAGYLIREWFEDVRWATDTEVHRFEDKEFDREWEKAQGV